MKKYIPILFVFTCCLSGCAKEISPEQADKVAEDIKNRSFNPEAIDSIKVTYKDSYHHEGTVERKVVDTKEAKSIKYELSNKYNYIHITGKTETSDKVEDTKSTNEVEEWIYIKKKVLYKVDRRKSIGSETKTYSKVEDYSKAVSEFSTYYSNFVHYAYEQARGSQYLDMDTLTTIFSEEYKYDIQYSAKFYSGGEGNLKVVGAAKIDKTYETGQKVKGAGTTACNWKNYFLKNLAIAFTLKVTDGTSKNDSRMNVGITQKVAKLVIPTYPNLNKYAEG